MTANRISPSALADTRLLFIALCCYLISHVYTVPLIPIGPWAAWPTLTDLAIGGMVLAWILSPRGVSYMSAAQRKVIIGFQFLVLVGALSYVLVTVLWTNWTSAEAYANGGVQFGGYEVFRLLQFLIAMVLTARIVFDQYRTQILSWIAAVVLVAVCLAIIATYFGWVSTSDFSRHLPTDFGTAGAWTPYRNGTITGEGLGTIGYNHAYVAAQVTMLLGLYLHLRPHSSLVGDISLITLSIAATLLSGSRAGFAAHLAFILVYLAWKSLPTLAIGGVFMVMGLVWYLNSSPPEATDTSGVIYVDTADQEVTITARQASLFSFTDSSNLSGRDIIWTGKLQHLNDDPIRWLTGWGLGSAGDVGPGLGAHMQPLHMVVELGAIVFLVIAVLFGGMLRLLWRAEGGSHPLFWMTAALLLGSMTQETFYPVAAMGHFLGLYLVSITIALRRRSADSPPPEPVSFSRASLRPVWRPIS